MISSLPPLTTLIFFLLSSPTEITVDDSPRCSECLKHFCKKLIGKHHVCTILADPSTRVECRDPIVVIIERFDNNYAQLAMS